MKNLIFILAIFTVTAVGAAPTPAKLVDGKVKYPVAKLGASYIWEPSEVAAILVSTPAAPIVVVTPSPLEVALSTSALTFENFSDFDKCRGAESKLGDKLDDLPPSQARKIPVQYLKDQSKNDSDSKGK